MDCLAKVFGVVRTPEGTGQPAGRERQSEQLAVELGHLGVGLDERPGTALDLCQRLENVRPGAAKGLYVPTPEGAGADCGGAA